MQAAGGKVRPSGRGPGRVRFLMAPAEEAVINQYQELGIERSIFAVPSESRDKVLPILDKYARVYVEYALDTNRQEEAGMIDLHYWPTPNGKKVTILLEECGMAYKMIPCNIAQGDQFTDEFLRICPNNRMPALVDHEPLGGGEPLSIFESGAMMMYIAEKAGQFYPQDVRGRYEVNQWLMWQMANQGPKSGECGHFSPFGRRPGRPDLRGPAFYG